MNILTIIDMQSGFCGNNSYYHGDVNGLEELEQEMIKNIINKIKEYKSKNLPIIFVEYADIEFGETIADIMNELVDYKHAHCVHKLQNSGAREIARKIREKNMFTDTIEIVGVNYDACVKETHKGLVKMGYDAVIVKKATNYKIYKISIGQVA